MDEFSNKISFNVFRYQLLPLTKTFQLSLLSDITSIEELKNRKNEFFNEAIKSMNKFEYTRSEIAHKILFHDTKFTYLKLGHQRLLNITDKSFQEESIEDWTPISIIINNDPSIQKILIEKNRKVFARTETVARLIEDNLITYLKRYNLGIYLEPIFSEEEFWQVVEKYPEQIAQVSFDLISPNLANISGALTFDLDSLHKDTNTKKTKLELNSDKESSLNIPHDNEMINGLVKYSSEGGGEISIRIKGMRRRIKMSKSVTEIDIDEANISAKNLNDIIPILKEIVQ